MAIIESKGNGYALYNGEKVLASEVPEGAEAISLDGMNVIEWDGDTDGLEKFGTTAFYRVSSATDVDVAKNCISVNFSNGVRNVLNQALTDEGEYYQNRVNRYVPVATENYSNAGIYLMRASSILWCPLFAYYPKLEHPEIDKGKLFLLYKIFSPDVFYAITGKKHWAE